MKRHRVFVAINLPENIRRKLTDYQKKIEKLFAPHQSETFGAGPVRWTKPNNIHITLVFLGYLSDEEILEVCKTVKEVASRQNSFDINLAKICYGPPQSSLTLTAGQSPDKKPPRMVWAVGEKSEEFASLKADLDKSLGVSENREFSPHITLGRIRKWEWQRIEPEERPEIEEEIGLGFPVISIEVMESLLKKGGSEYIVFESANLL